MSHVKADEKEYEKGHKWGYLTIPVLEFLWGRKWDDDAKAFLRCLRPTGVRIAREGTRTDVGLWRVTVWLQGDDTIKRIEHECECDLYGQENGGDLWRRVEKESV